MSIDFRNLNTLWGSILVETLARLGLKIGVVSPGSRSTPLTVALARHPQIEAIPILDERSAAFFALGLAKRHPDWLTQRQDKSVIWWEGKVHQRVWLNPLHPQVQSYC